MINFDSQEFIDLVDELMADAMDVEILKWPATRGFDPSTLKVVTVEPERIPSKMVFVPPSLSKIGKFEREDEEMTTAEFKFAIISYRGELDNHAEIETPGINLYKIKAVIALNPLGVTVYQRLKLYR